MLNETSFFEKIKEYETKILNIETEISNKIYDDISKNIKTEIFNIYNIILKNIDKKNIEIKYENIEIFAAYSSIFIKIYPIKINKITTNHNILNFLTNNIQKLITWKKYEFDNKKIRNYLFKIVSTLEEEKILTYNKKKIEKKTIKHYTNLENNINIYEQITKKYSHYEYKLITHENKHYIYKDHFLTLYNIQKKNDLNNNIINFKNTNTIEKLLKNNHFIDWDLYKKLLQIQIVELGYKTEKEIFDSFEIYKKNIKINTEEINIKLSQLYSIIEHINFYHKNKDNKKPIFFQFSFDFRGRLYYDYECSPTNSKITRNSICYKNIKKIEHESKTKKIILEYIKFLEKKHENLNEQNKIKILWILISIGKICRKKNEKIINIETFIKNGIEEINKNNTTKHDFDDELDLFKLKYIYEKIISNNLEYVYTINKDATASGFQHLLKILGTEDKTTYKYCNMNDHLNWYDTYSFLIETFIKKNNIELKYHKYLERSALKKTIMIENYGATFYKCLQEYKKKIKITDETTIESIEAIFKKIYEDLHNQSLGNFFKKKIVTTYEDIEINDATTTLSYKKKKKKQLSYIKNKKRYTLQEYETTENIDTKKTKKAFKANLTHTSDSEIVRRIIDKWENPLITIHDCFLVDLENINEFIDLYNIEMKKSSFKNSKYHENIDENMYSIFIII